MARSSSPSFRSLAELVLVTSLALYGIAPSSYSYAQTSAVPSKPGSVAASSELRIVSTEFKFSQSSKHVLAGRPVTIVLDNSQGETEHLIVARALGLRIFARAGEVVKKDYIFEKPGEFEFICDLPGHLEAGMKGSVSVIASESGQSKGHDAAKN
jgi:uncharacterized cupredoxin-like copper-binding protein